MHPTALQQFRREGFVVHRRAPLLIEGRRRLVERCRSRAISHVATEMGISRATTSKWVNRYRRDIGFMTDHPRRDNNRGQHLVESST